MKTLRWLSLTLIVVASLAAYAGARQDASAEDVAEPTVLQVSSFPVTDDQGDEVPGQFWIMATLTTEDGRYVANRPLQIVEPVQFFGYREATLGNAVTDGTGMAAAQYQPSNAGESTILVRFGGDAKYAASKAELVIDAASVVAPFPEEGRPLASVGTGLAIFLAVLGVAFWAVLLGVLGNTVRRIKRAAALQAA